jgi:hypothetical protein
MFYGLVTVICGAVAVGVGVLVGSVTVIVGAVAVGVDGGITVLPFKILAVIFPSLSLNKNI